MAKQYRMKVYGKVQGVYYRVSTQKTAVAIGLSGWVMNNKDGTVDILAEGEEDQLRELFVWCDSGPDGAEVEKVEVVESEAEGKDSFVIL